MDKCSVRNDRTDETCANDADENLDDELVGWVNEVWRPATGYYVRANTVCDHHLDMMPEV